MTRPNILYITADQQRADCFGFRGRKVKTPHLDQLAASGTHFTSCITPNVVCQPSRGSILTGLLPRTHGAHDNGIDLPADLGEKGFAGALAAAGYHTAFFGKAHFSTFNTFEPTGRPECIQSSANYSEDWYGPYMGFQHVELMLIGHNWFLPNPPPKGLHYERWFYADGRGEEKNRLYADNAGDTRGAAQTYHSRLPVAWHNTTWTADRTIAYLQHAKPDQPFCAWVSFPDPHHPFDCPEPWSWLHKPEEVDLPEHRTRDFERRPWWHKQVLTAEPPGDPKMAINRKTYSRIPPQTDEQLREIIANTYGQLALIDHNVGRILVALQEQGLADNTLVVYSSDHGDWLGDHGLILKGPMHYDGLLNVPMIIAGPGIPAGQVNDEPVSSLDLGATFYDYARAEPLQKQHSQSLRPLIENPSATRDFAYNEWELLPARTGVPLSLRTVRTKAYKLTIDEQSGAGEMYDRVNDPGEMNNIFDSPSAAAARKELLDMIAARPDDALPPQAPVGQA
ncbi:sulfatase-like hydrolase/transferase [Candidatus Entotheonella palauensis]|uniref:sulfatase-like hydrolase/transferase n=1 Tax=Candidatus Entotheonella palauensis TaxID=93172 RepID=UPI000B7C5E86|nr:sulfatase-like hydrolase/transferase [Candidatus Entotheonella palauensis]